MKSPAKLFAWLAAAALLAAMISSVRWSALVSWDISARAPGHLLVFDQVRGCAIGVPDNPSPEEERAAKLVQDTLARASGRPGGDFPIRRASDGSDIRIRLSGTNHRRAGESRLDEKVTWRVTERSVEISSYPADAIEAAAAWFLQQTLGARWFIPGELGEHVPLRPELSLGWGEHFHSPSYISRNLGVVNSPLEQDWWNRNRLRAWFHHGHAMSALFSPADLKQHPDFAPVVAGVRFIPQSASEDNWQPNIVAEGAAEHAAAVLRRRHEFSSALGMNDSIRFDQSLATQAAVGSPGWFRLKPDYSKLVFGFVNGVARNFPGRFVCAYAYDWAENTPGFRMERNVVPFLTADRSEWFDPVFAAEDQALIKRWLAAGSEVVGLYDYYEGVPFLVPRPTLYAVKQSLPWAYRAGVRAFYAEGFPNWGLDGPKAWLAAELLWDAKADPEELLRIYYTDFWREAAGPMREFFELCDAQWMTQPKPAYWIKYYKDEDQHLLFPAEVRRQLREQLGTARALARSDVTRSRVEFCAAAFAVSEAFCAWEEAKEILSRLSLPARPDLAQLSAAFRALTEAEQHLRQVLSRTKHQAPLAVQSSLLSEFERNDPRRRAVWRLAQGGRADSFSAELGGQSSLQLSGPELLEDATLGGLRIRPPAGPRDLEWVEVGRWRGHGEPYETRRVSLAASPGSPSGNSGKALRFEGCKQETFSQFRPAHPETTYVARVKVRARVSPGNLTFVILNFQDAEGRALGYGVVDRLPAGDYGEEVELVTWAKAPANAKWVGLGVRALNQVSDDYALFEDFSLQAMR